MARLVATGDWRDYQKLPNMRSYDRDTIEAVVRKLTGVANKRLSSLANAGMQKTDSYRNVADEYKSARFPTNYKNMSRNDLLKQYSRLNWFLDNKTSTVKGARQVISDFNERIGYELTEQQREHFWSIYDKLKELASIQTQLYYLDSERIQEEIGAYIEDDMSSADIDNVVDEMMFGVKIMSAQKTNKTYDLKKDYAKIKNLNIEDISDAWVDYMQQKYKYKR